MTTDTTKSYVSFRFNSAQINTLTDEFIGYVNDAQIPCKGVIVHSNTSVSTYMRMIIQFEFLADVSSYVSGTYLNELTADGHPLGYATWYWFKYSEQEGFFHINPTSSGSDFPNGGTLNVPSGTSSNANEYINGELGDVLSSAGINAKIVWLGWQS